MTLYPHQTKSLAETAALNRVAYYWDMGLGKTYIGSEKMMQLGAKVNLVVCQKSKLNDWREHFINNYVNIDVCNLTTEKDLTAFKKGNIAVDRMVGIINYDLAWRRPELLKLSDFTLLLDESSLIQNETAKRSKFILRMRPANVILLSGTPTGGKYERLWSQMQLLGWDIPKCLYWSEFVITRPLDINGRSIEIVTGYKNIPRLKAKMAQYGCQFLRTDEVFDLPTQIFQTVHVATTNAYTRFKRDHIVEVDGVQLIGDTTLTRMLYMRQLCGIYNKAKLDVFEDLLESTDDRLIVFYNFNAELHKMRERCGSRHISIVNGSIKDLSNYETHDDTVTFVQYQAGAMGLNLQKANKVIYYSLPLSSELFEQSKKRVHRIGQSKPCFYYVMICKGSIEERIRIALALRRDYTEKLFEKEENENV